MKRRILSLALALMMCLALLPTAAFAADGDLTIENGVLTKYNGSNYGPNYVDIVVPDGVTKIGEQAFNNCFVLSGVTLPDSVTTIGEGAFLGCQHLHKINLPASVTTIEAHAFDSCYALGNLTIPASVTSIGAYAFCVTAMQSVTVPDGITAIEEGTFFDCPQLTSVTIPASVTSIGSAAFTKSNPMFPSVTDVYFGGSEAQWKAIHLTKYDWELEQDVPTTDLAGVGLDKATIHYNSAGPAAQSLAYASTQNVLVDGEPVEFQCYALKDANGNDTNYVKVRDLAYVLNGTAAQFNVGWDGSVNLEKGKAYASNGSEMNTPFSGNRAYQASAAQTKVDGAAVKLESIVLNDDNGGGYTYYKLRDLGAALGFTVDWSKEKGVYIETK